MARYNTNLASEFYILSCLHRLGLDAYLTLGNKKSVDIVVVSEEGIAITVDVKGIAGKYEWPADNLKTNNPNKHFVALVSYEGDIDKIEMPPPRVWIIPFTEIEQFKREYKTRTNVSRSKILQNADEYENAWHLIAGIVSS